MHIDVLLTAVSASGSGERLRSAGEGGMALTSEPVLTRKHVLSVVVFNKYLGSNSTVQN